MAFGFLKPRPPATEPDLETAAYQRGRRDEARRRRRSPAITMLMGGAALVGAATLGFAAAGGSFSAGGQAIDRSLSAAINTSGPALRDLAANSSQGFNALKQKLHMTAAPPTAYSPTAAPPAPAKGA